MKKVVICLAEGFEEIEAVTTADILKRAGLDVKMVSFTGELIVSGAHGITLRADRTFDESGLEGFDMIVLPGGMPGASNLHKHDGLRKWLLDYASRPDRYLAAICAAPMVLGELGILRDKKATCYPGFEKYLTGAHWISEGVVRDGSVITAQAAGFSAAFALEIAALLAGREIAARVASAIKLPGGWS